MKNSTPRISRLCSRRSYFRIGSVSLQILTCLVVVFSTLGTAIGQGLQSESIPCQLLNFDCPVEDVSVTPLAYDFWKLYSSAERERILATIRGSSVECTDDFGEKGENYRYITGSSFSIKPNPSVPKPSDLSQEEGPIPNPYVDPPVLTRNFLWRLDVTFTSRVLKKGLILKIRL